MKIEFYHFLARKQVSERAKLLLTEVVNGSNKLILNMEEKWDGDVCHFNFLIKRKVLKMIYGQIRIEGPFVFVKIVVPFFLFSLKIKLRKIFHKKMNEVFGYAKNKNTNPKPPKNLL
ncbi:hypothetical protein KKA39_02110 [Patescibacteria group bacterium]|nr:hypothetical protein [Patescibacteria group bacterium]MBU1728078.1 hypothetical protein [Patescibacteria group bacterium]